MVEREGVCERERERERWRKYWLIYRQKIISFSCHWLRGSLKTDFMVARLLPKRLHHSLHFGQSRMEDKPVDRLVSLYLFSDRRDEVKQFFKFLLYLSYCIGVPSAW